MTALRCGVAIGQEPGRRGDGEIAGHLAPDVVELIGLGPDVGAGPRDLVLPRGRVELRGSLQRRRADIVGIRERAERGGLGQGGRGQQAGEEQFAHGGILSDSFHSIDANRVCHDNRLGLQVNILR